MGLQENLGRNPSLGLTRAPGAKPLSPLFAGTYDHVKNKIKLFPAKNIDPTLDKCRRLLYNSKPTKQTDKVVTRLALRNRGRSRKILFSSA